MRFFRIAHPAFHPLHKKQPFMNRSLFALRVIPTRRAAVKTSLFAASFLFFFALLSFQASAQGCESGDCTNGFGTYRFDDGSVYIGFFQNGRQKGQGTFIWSNGDKYEGQWVAGKQDGEALFTFANGLPSPQLGKTATCYVKANPTAASLLITHPPQPKLLPPLHPNKPTPPPAHHLSKALHLHPPKRTLTRIMSSLLSSSHHHKPNAVSHSAPSMKKLSFGGMLPTIKASKPCV